MLMKIGLIGTTGRIGMLLVDIIKKDQNLEFSGGVSSKSTVDDLQNIIKNSDVLIDFSNPEATMSAISIAAERGVPFVSGTTGLSKENFNTIKKFSSIIPVLYASNFSICVQLMFILMKKCSEILKNFDVSIIDKHHNQKKDAPSGTALFLAKAVNSNAQIVSIRAGNIFGEHICDFTGENEMLTISHQSFNRRVYAEGAIICAKWLMGKSSGMYSLMDCLGVENYE